MPETPGAGNRFPQPAFVRMMRLGKSEAIVLHRCQREGSSLSLLARLAPHLPYVRRYARALTGDQPTGDHYVRVALEALAAGERVLEANLTPRVALYHVFH